LINEALEAAGPLTLKFVDIVAAHLVYDENDHKFWPWVISRRLRPGPFLRGAMRCDGLRACRQRG